MKNNKAPEQWEPLLDAPLIVAPTHGYLHKKYGPPVLIHPYHFIEGRQMNYVRCRYKAPDKLVERNTSPGPMADDLAEKIGIVKARLSQLLSTVLTDLRFDLTTLSWL